MWSLEHKQWFRVNFTELQAKIPFRYASQIKQKKKKHTMRTELYFPRENILPHLKMTKYQKDFLLHGILFYISKLLKCFGLSSEGRYLGSLFDTTLYPLVLKQDLHCPLGTALNKCSLCEPHELLGDRLFYKGGSFWPDFFLKLKLIEWIV